MSLSEFSIIERLAQRASGARPDVCLGIGDDGAVVKVPQGMELVVSMDTIVEGVHFPSALEPRSIGHKALAVNLSDMAAMGAEPAWATMGLTLPESEPQWIEEFADGFFSLAERYSVALIGGDVTRGPLSVTVQMHGLVPVGMALQRSGAKVGDQIFVTGTLGDAGMGLWLAGNESAPLSDDGCQVMERLHRPEPRVWTGAALRGIASACIDISDGLLADLGHLLNASWVGATIFVDQLPRSDAYINLLEYLPADGGNDPYTIPLTAGDDYELCFTVPAAAHARLAKALEGAGVPCTVIGEIQAEKGVRCVKKDGEPYQPRGAGYQHFAGSQR